MSMGKRRRVNGAENDAFSRYSRRLLCYLTRPGITAKIKRGARRRERHEAKRQTRLESADA